MDHFGMVTLVGITEVPSSTHFLVSRTSIDFLHPVDFAAGVGFKKSDVADDFAVLKLFDFTNLFRFTKDEGGAHFIGIATGSGFTNLVGFSTFNGAGFATCIVTSCSSG